MKKLITERLAINGLFLILTLFALFHVVILLGLIPYEMVWGGKLKNQAEMRVSETVSLIINLIMLAAVAIKAGFLKIYLPPMLINIVFWAMFGLFMVNTVGNALSLNTFEKIVFTPLTLILAIFSLRIAIK
jgi:hypothetical protein